jgi:hypothetical protein
MAIVVDAWAGKQSAPEDDPYVVLARDVLRQVLARFDDRNPPTKGSFTVYADAKMVQDVLKKEKEQQQS